MRTLFIIRHTNSKPTPDTDARNWQVTPEGHDRIQKLAEKLADRQIETVFTSTEHKAILTGEILADALGADLEDPMPEFDEQGLGNTPFIDTIEGFRAKVGEMFDNPADIIFGDESGFDARGRFAGGLYEVLDETPNGNIAIVSHGRVMSLFVGRFSADNDAKEIWLQIQALGMPCVAEFSLPDLEFISLTGL